MLYDIKRCENNMKLNEGLIKFVKEILKLIDKTFQTYYN